MRHSHDAELYFKADQTKFSNSDHDCAVASFGDMCHVTLHSTYLDNTYLNLTLNCIVFPGKMIPWARLAFVTLTTTSLRRNVFTLGRGGH